MNERNGNRFLSRVSGFALAAALGGALVLPFVSNEASVVAPANAP